MTVYDGVPISSVPRNTVFDSFGMDILGPHFPNQNVKYNYCLVLINSCSMISKVAIDHPKSWFNHLGCILWALREAPQESLGVPPWLVVCGRIPRRPLAVLKDGSS